MGHKGNGTRTQRHRFTGPFRGRATPTPGAPRGHGLPRGHGGGWAAEGRTAVGGDVAINPSGGLLAKGHPVGATGIGQLYEVVHQLRGTHPNQVAGATVGMTHNLGGTGVACTVSLLRRSDA